MRDNVVLGGRGVPVETAPFSVNPTLLELDGRRYVGPLLMCSLEDMHNGRHSGGVSRIGGGCSSSRGGGNISGRGKGGGAGQRGTGVGYRGDEGVMRVWVRYEAHLPTLYLPDEENSRTVLEEVFLPTVQGHVI